ncbi:MAG TPA: hydroxyacid dehydrogenase [Nitrososphaerales archaeon]|nr:hydroxyacid dehydrogenase [Nitrososphaerales archaeon]
MRILVSDAISADAINLLNSSGIEFEYEPDISPQTLLSIIEHFDALIVRSRTRVTKEVISAAPNLKVIGRAGVGVDNIDLEAAMERKIAVLNTPNALTNAVAEFTLGLMIGLARKIPVADASTKIGKWEKSKFQGIELKGKTYGTIGIGKIGQRVAELASAFSMKIVANDVIPIPEELVKRLGIRVSNQNEVFLLSDFVDIHVPLTPETENLVNYDKLKMMKKTAFLINTSRGKVVDEKDLLQALSEKIIAGAALDVYDSEPPTSFELLKLDNVIATPHIAGQTAEAQSMAGIQIVELVVKALNSP